ncbi:MAG TPA: hypothetical protein VGD65_05025 [Chryseosolibacter sp.]
MKKLPLIITIGIVALLAGGYLAYIKLKPAPVKPWDLVPADAIAVYEKDNCDDCVKAVGRSSVWSVLENVFFYKRPVDTLRSRVHRVVAARRGMLVSMHVTKKDELDLIFYLPGGANLVSASDLSNVKGHSLRTRAFNGVTISEIRIGQHVFSFANIEGVSVGSFTPFLVEDVIRSYRNHDDGAMGKQAAFGSLQFTSIKDDAGNLYIRLESLQEFLSVFVDQPMLGYTFGRSALLDIKADESSLTLNGFSTDSIDRARYFLSVFKHQNPVAFGLKNLISNRVVAVSSYGISDGKSFSNDLSEFVKASRVRLRDTLELLSGKYSLGIESLYARIADEIAICFLESRRHNGFSKVLLIESSDEKPFLKAFATIGDRLSVDTVFYERYSQYEIREIPVHKFAEKLLWPFVTGFHHSYYTSIGNVVVMGDDVEELKSFLDDIDSEETWGRSVSQNRFLEGTLLESNVSLYVNPARLWNVYSSRFQPRWQNFIRDKRSLLQSLGMSSIQFSHLNNSYYTNALFTFRSYKDTDAPVKNPRTTVTVFESGVSSLTAVRSHVNRSNEVLVQDSLNNLSLVSADGKVLWKLPIGERITSDVTQVDFFNNGKLQYFFATQFSLHVIDRLGNYVNPFPINLSGVDIDKVSVVDYDNSKKYRFLVGDKAGKIFMYDKEGNLLEGWNPNTAGGLLSSAPRHYRIKGKDYIIACRKDGVVNLWTRRGEILRKFPVDLQAEPMGDVFLERGNTLEDTYFVFITRDGFRIRLTPEGKIQSKETLLRTSIRSTFSLVTEKSGKTYLSVQQDERQVTITDADGRKIVSAPVAGSLFGDVKYYDHGSGKTFITVRDRAQGFYYVYDGQGNLLTTPPVVTPLLEIRPVDSDEFTLFFIHERSLVIQPL